MTSRRVHILEHHKSSHHEKNINKLTYEDINELIYI